MYTFKRQPTPLETDYGDIGIYGEHANYVKKFDVKQYKERQLIKLMSAGAWNPWDVLKSLGFDVDPLITMATYDCPLTNRSYVALLPVYLVTDDLAIKTGKVEACKYPVDHLGWLRDMACDTQWSQDRDASGLDLDRKGEDGRTLTRNEAFFQLKDDQLKSYLAQQWSEGTLPTLFMGSGYTHYIMPNDGGYSIIPVMIEIEGSNDVVLAITFDWHNK